MNKPHVQQETGEFTPRGEVVGPHSITNPLDTAPQCHDGTEPEMPALGAPRAIPGFEIVREVGRGGMGVVFEAIELALNRPVAIKVLIAERYSTAEELIRFRLEAEVAARVAHPNVVRVHGGSTHDGQPYLVLEWIGGGTLAEAVGNSPLPPATAARLLAVLARAVQAAHANGVVHRDLKPNNILLAPVSDETLVDSASAVTLTVRGAPHAVVPKVTDFGLAKLIVGTAGLTETGRVMGTPDYMAPEQAAGRTAEVGPATDIHALGAILYQLLTGRTPFHADTMMATIRRVSDEEASPPRSLVRQIPRDLETICLKCLHKQPARRYASAAELADDLEAYLAGRPIRARHVGTLERVRLWAARRPAVAALSAAVVMLVVGGFAGVTAAWLHADSQRRRAETAEAEARQSAATSEAVNRFLVTEMLASAAPEKAQGRTITVADVLHEASLRVGTAFPNQEEVEAGVRFAIGRSYRSLGKPAEALPHLERAVALRRDRRGEKHADTLRATGELALTRDDLGQWDEAERDLRQAVEAAAALGADNPVLLDLRAALAMSLQTHGRGAEAEPLLVEAVEVGRRVHGDKHPETLRARNNLGVLYYHQGRYADAEQLLAACLADRRATLSTKHPDTLEAMNNLAAVQEARKQWDDAHKLFAEVVETSRSVRGPRHPDTLAALSNLARLSFARGKPHEALPLYQQAYTIASEDLSADHPLTLKFRHNLGTAYFQAREFQKAEKELTAVLAARRRVLPPGHADLIQSLTDVGIYHARSGDSDRGATLLREAHAMTREKNGVGHPATVKAVLRLAEVLRQTRQLGNLNEATRLLTESSDALRLLEGREPQIADLRALQVKLEQSRQQLARESR